MATFFWPRMSKHVYHYCKSCDQCQRLDKSRTPSFALLMPLPVMTEPWNRIAIDIVGPLCLNTTVVPSATTSDVHDSEPDFGPVLTTNDAFSLDHLPDRDREQLQRLLCQYSQIFIDNPGKTNLCTHKIELKPGTRPIRLSPYRVHPQKADQIRQELDRWATCLECTARKHQTYIIA